MLLLSEADLRGVLEPDDLIDAMEGALARFSSGRVVQPLRTVVEVNGRGLLFLMPAYVRSAEGGEDDRPPQSGGPAAPQGTPFGDGDEGLGAKLVTLFEGNARRGLPTHLATVLLLDPETGAPLALVDGRYLTEVRTAAVSAVSARHLAPADRPLTLAVIGSGVQARSHVIYLPHVRRIGTIRVWSPTTAHRERFVAELRSRVAAPLVACATAADAVIGADLIVVATSAREPVVARSWVAPGAHVIAVGAPRPDQRELDPALVAEARLFVDSRIAALQEAGDIVSSIAEGYFGPDHIAGELGELILRRVVGRTRPDETTLFKSLGMAVEDVVAARLAYARARRAGVGTTVTL